VKNDYGKEIPKLHNYKFMSLDLYNNSSQIARLISLLLKYNRAGTRSSEIPSEQKRIGANENGNNGDNVASQFALLSALMRTLIKVLLLVNTFVVYTVLVVVD
jgi:hypothetical protein